MDLYKNRIYELLEKLFVDDSTDCHVDNFYTSRETIVRELAILFTHHNPFIKLQTATLAFANIVGNKDSIVAFYKHGHKIFYSTLSIKNISKNPKDICELLDSIYHEQRHNTQEYAQEFNQEILNNINMKEIYTSMFNSKLSPEKIAELYSFATKYNFLKLKPSQSKLEELQDGSYLSNKAEIDARDSAFKNTMLTINAMIQDKACPEILKDYLRISLLLYEKNHQENENDTKLVMKSFLSLERRAEKTLLRAVSSDTEIGETTYNQLLNGVLYHTTRNMSITDRLEIVTWAIKNDYIKLLNQINLNNILSSEIKYIENYLFSISKRGLVNSRNLSSLANLYATVIGNQKEAFDQLIEIQIELKKPLVLLDYMLLRKNNMHISAHHLAMCLSNYLYAIRKNGKIIKVQEFHNIRDKLKLLIYHSPILNENDKRLLLKLYNNFNVIASNTPTTEQVAHLTVSN